MSNSGDRLQTAQWVLERNLAWIAAAEVKIGVVVTLQLAMTGCLAAAFSSADALTRTAPANLATAVTVGGALISFGCAAGVIWPRTKGPSESILFFGRIAEVKLDDFQEKFRLMSDADILADWSAQIHRNAEIAREKHGWVTKAVGWTLFTALSWIVSVGFLVKI